MIWVDPVASPAAVRGNRDLGRVTGTAGRWRRDHKQRNEGLLEAAKGRKQTPYWSLQKKPTLPTHRFQPATPV